MLTSPAGRLDYEDTRDWPSLGLEEADPVWLWLDSYGLDIVPNNWLADNNKSIGSIISLEEEPWRRSLLTQLQRDGGGAVGGVPASHPDLQLGQDQSCQGLYRGGQEQVGAVYAGAGVVQYQGGPGRLRYFVNVRAEVCNQGAPVSGGDHMCVSLQ